MIDTIKYNPAIHHRSSIRLKGYDYSRAGMYFVTICVKRRSEKFFAFTFGEIVDGEMVLNNAGKIVEKCWLEIVQHYPNAVLHEYVVMPNHVHGIIELINDGNDTQPSVVGAKNFSPHETPNETSFSPNKTPVFSPNDNDTQTSVMRAKNFSPLRGTSRTIGAIVRGFKIGVTKQLGYSVWQRNYWEHIIRNEQSYQRIANYIINNPQNWNNDEFYLE